LNLLTQIAKANGYSIPKTVSIETNIYPVNEWSKRQGVDIGSRDKDYLETYATIPWVYSCVYQIQIAISMLQFQIFRKTGTDKTENVTSEEKFDLFRKPNPNMGSFLFWMHTSGNMELTGKSFWWIAKDGNRLAGIFPLRSDRISIIPGDSQQFIKGFLYEINNKKTEFKPEEIFYMRYYHPYDDYDGLSAVEASRSSIIMHLKSVIYNKALMDNQVRPSGAFMSEKPVMQSQWDRTKKEFKEKYAGIMNAGEPIFVDGYTKYESLQLKPADMEYIEQNKMTKGQFLSTIGVPPVLIQDYSDAKVVANSKVQIKNFMENTIIPKTKMYLESLNDYILPLFVGEDSRYFIDVDLTNIDALQENILMTIKKFVEGFKLAAVSPNDYRQHVLRLDRVNDPELDKHYLPMNLFPVGEAPVSTEPSKGKVKLLNSGEVYLNYKKGVI